MIMVKEREEEENRNDAMILIIVMITMEENDDGGADLPFFSVLAVNLSPPAALADKGNQMAMTNNGMTNHDNG